MKLLLLQPPFTSLVLGPNTLLSTLFSNTINICSSFSAGDQVSHAGKVARKIFI